MDNSQNVVIYFEYGGIYSDVGDEVRWNRKDQHISTLVLKRSYEEVTYSHLVDRIGMKMKINVGAIKVQMSHFQLVMDHKRPCYIMDDEDILGYLLEVDKNQRCSVLHVELTESISENQNNEMFSGNEEILSEDRGNGDMVGLKELSIMPHIQEDANERTNEVSDERHHLEELSVVTHVETPVLHLEWDDGIDMTLHQEFETKHEVRDLVDKDVHKNCFEVDIVKSKPRLYVLKCCGVGCKWYLRAEKLHNSDFFSIRTYRKMHTCVRIDASATRKGKRGTQSMVASVLHADYPGKFKTPTPKDLIYLVQTRWGVRVSYSKAMRQKNKAINEVRGNHKRVL
ncbi:hypothetical protein N665_0010s0014 [Sinapis alba]|nr:hypothetical protein N665_0010s0014 [Sinapis alba]